MAGNVQIAIKDAQAAKVWLEMVRGIDSDYLKAMTDATESMGNIKDFADGTIIDELVKYADGLCNAAQKTFDAIDAIADTVNGILGSVDNFVSKAAGGLGKLASMILNQ